MSEILICKNICINYSNTTAVKDVSFSVQSGDYICVVGENGSGKSTLLKGILGLIPVKSGSVRFGGGLKKNEIGYLPQQTAVQHDFPASVYEVVLSGCINKLGLRPFFGKKEHALAEKNIELLHIGDLKKRSYRELSGGQQQRVLLARALCATEKILLLDEPVTGLDPIVTQEFYSVIKQLNRELGVAVIMVSHDVSSAVRSANKILHLDLGAEFFGSTEEYLKSDVGKRFSKEGCIGD